MVIAEETDWIQEGNKSYKTLTFPSPITEEQLFLYAQSKACWGYHPAGYGCEIQKINDTTWRWYRWNTCD